jgi:hypothetical protein
MTDQPGTTRPSPLLSLPGAVAGDGIDAPVAAHYGSFRPSVLTSIDRDQKLRSLRRPAIGVDVACAEACSISAVLQIAKRTVAKGTGGIGAAGRTRVKMERNSRRAPKKAVTAVLTVRVVDAAGNVTRTRRTIRFQ